MKVTLKPILTPTDHRLGDLPIGAIVAGERYGERQMFAVYCQGRTVALRGLVDGELVYRDPDTRIAVAYEPIELEVPE